MKLTRKAGIVVTVLCIMALVIAAAGAADMPGPTGQQSAGTGSKQQGPAPGPQQQMADTNINQSGHSGSGAPQGQGNGPRGGNVTMPGQEQGARMPVEEVIAQLELKGYDVSDVKTLLQNDNREEVKTWLDMFKKNNPGVVEEIEGTKTNNLQVQKTGSGSSGPGNPPRQMEQSADKSIFDIIISWFLNLL